MKKTIAILLVLVLAGVGLFADPTTNDSDSILVLQTTVLPINRIAVTAAEFSLTAPTLALFAAQTELSTTPVTVASGTLAYLSLVTNNPAGVNVYFSGEKLAGTGTNTYEINYTVSCGAGMYDTSAPVDDVVVVAAANSKAESKLFFGSYPITASLKSTDFDNAPIDTYTGTVTFTFETV